MKVVPDKNDDAVGDIKNSIHVDGSPNCQLSNQQSPLRTADRNAPLGTAWKVGDTEDCQTSKLQIDEVNTGGLRVMDCCP